MKTTTKVCPRFSNKNSERASVQVTVYYVLRLHNSEIKSGNMKTNWSQLFWFANSEELKNFTSWSKCTSLVRRMKNQHTACILEINFISAAYSTVYWWPPGVLPVRSTASQRQHPRGGDTRRKKLIFSQFSEINLFILPSLHHFHSWRVLILTIN